MERNKILQSDVLDIIFDQRNKTYGAYELRKNYHKRARLSLMIVGVLALVCVSLPLISSLLSDKETHAISFNRETVLTEIVTPIVKPREPRPQKPPTCPTPNTKVFTQPKIVVAKEADPDKVLPPADDTRPASTQAKEGPDDSTPSITPPGDPKPVVVVEQPKTDPVYDAPMIDQLPEFPGGEPELEKFLMSHLKFPQRASDAGQSGRVKIEFIIDAEGKISAVTALRKAGYGFDEEAMRVISSMPDWKPGRINGKAVSVRFVLPVTFNLETDH